MGQGDDKGLEEAGVIEGGGSLKVCVSCEKAQPRESYSNKQWIGKAHSRRCNECISSGEPVALPSVRGSTVAGGANKAEDGGKKKKACEGTEEDDDLTALIKGIVFADPLSTLKKATREAVSKFKALGRDPPSAAAVKAVWLKLGLDKQDDDALIHKFWTIGVNPDAKSVATEDDKALLVQGSDDVKDDGVWFPVELDVPGNRTGSMPHQALMSHNKTLAGEHRGRFGEIFKVQVAQDAPPQSPMLLYNQGRTKKTFIHCDAPGYAEIGDAVLAHGMLGEQGASGGHKAFFYGRFDRKKEVVLLRVSEPAEPQPW